jgi:ribonuclease T1
MMLRAAIVAMLLSLPAALPPAHARTDTAERAEVALEELPPEARATVASVRRGGPFKYAKDGAVFGNREGQLPAQKRGYYHEYTVKTPGERTRGARRVIAGATGELYYTDDHYNHFRRIRE